MSEVALNVGQDVVATANFIDAAGNPVAVDNLVWTADVDGVVVITPGESQTALLAAVGEGVVNLIGTTTTLSGVVVVTEPAVVTVAAVVPPAPEAVSGTITFGDVVTPA